MHSIATAVLASLAMLAAMLPAHAAFQPIYEVLGVYDDGGGTNAGVATVFHCTNLSANPVRVRVRILDSIGSTVGLALTTELGPRGSDTFSTHPTAMFTDGDLNLQTGLVKQGRARIMTEAPPAIVCAADLLDAANATPAFLAPRRMIRLPRSNGGED